MSVLIFFLTSKKNQHFLFLLITTFFANQNKIYIYIYSTLSLFIGYFLFFPIQNIILFFLHIKPKTKQNKKNHNIVYILNNTTILEPLNKKIKMGFQKLGFQALFI